MCAVTGRAAYPVELITLDPGHFHASLVQKYMYPQVSPTVHVYAPAGADLEQHLLRINGFNSRGADPTHWQEEVYTGKDYLERMLRDRPGNVVVIAGNNTRKTQYLYRSVKGGLNVLADKPMAINPEGFGLLRKAFGVAAEKRVLLYDIMTERYEIANILQRELSRDAAVFGTLDPGSTEHPAVEMESVHYLFKNVAGKPLIRPAWFFDVRQEGEPLADVGTHLVDLVQWVCFPEQALDWQKDIQVQGARRWATRVTREGFQKVTGVAEYPKFLAKDRTADGALELLVNGELEYKLKGVQVKLRTLWEFEPPAGGADTFTSVFRGTKATLTILQGAEQNFVPALFVEKCGGTVGKEWESGLRAAVSRLSERFPGLELKAAGGRWEVVIPKSLQTGHESHFAQVMERFLSYLAQGRLPDWEVPNMIAKYYTTTEAVRLSQRGR
jgi:predicted dehydrogenase